MDLSRSSPSPALSVPLSPSPAAAEDDHAIDKRMLGLLSAGHFTVDLCQGVLPLTLPFLFTKLHLNYASVAFVITVAYLTSSVTQPIFGFVRWPILRKIALPLGVILACTSLACITLATSYSMVLLATLLSSIGVAAYHPEAAARANEACGAKKTGRGMAFFALSGSLGFSTGALIFGPLLAWKGLHATWGLLVPAVVIGGLMLGIAGKIARPKAASGQPAKFTRRIAIALGLLIGVVAIRQWVQAGTMTFLPLYYTNYLGNNPAFAAGLLLALALGNDCGTLACGYLGERFGFRTSIIVALALAGPLLFGLHFLHGYGLHVLLFFTGIAQAMPVLGTTIIGQQLLPQNKALAASLTLGLGAGVGGIASGLLGVLADHTSLSAALWCLAIIPLAGMAMALALPRPKTA